MYATTDLPKELKRLLAAGLTFDEAVVLAYLMREWSVGEILIFEELKRVCRLHECRRILRSLAERGLARYARGCCYSVDADAVARLLNLQDRMEVRKVGLSLLRFLRRWYSVPTRLL